MRNPMAPRAAQPVTQHIPQTAPTPSHGPRELTKTERRLARQAAETAAAPTTPATFRTKAERREAREAAEKLAASATAARAARPAAVPTQSRSLPRPAAPVPVAQPKRAGGSVTADFPMARKAAKGDTRKRVLLVVGKTDWVFGNIARQVATELYADPGVAVGVQAFSAINAEHVDLVVSLGWGAMAHIGPNVRADRVLLGVYDNVSWRSVQRRGAWHAALRRASGVIAANPRIAADLRASDVALPIYTLPDGVETGRFQPAPMPAEFTVGWAGNSACSPGRDIKGVEIIETAAKLAGVKLEMADAVVAKRPFAEMPAFYRSLSVYLCASESEGTPNPVLEAMASGRPVITTNVGIVPELVTPANGVVVERTPEAFAAAITRLKELPATELQAMGRAARTAAEAHDWSKRLPAWRDAIRTALKE